MFHCTRFDDTVLSDVSVVGTSIVRAVAMLVLLVMGKLALQIMVRHPRCVFVN